MDKYDLVGVNGNAFSIISYVLQAMKECNFSKDERDSFKRELLSSKDYDSLLFRSIGMIDKCNSISERD